MVVWYREISVNTSALPVGEPFFEKLEPLLRRCVEERSGAQVVNGAAEYTVHFTLNRALASEAFELRSVEGGVEIGGADFNALIYGLGKFLHKSGYSDKGISPADWRGVSAPKSGLRAVYFAMHFFNWYQMCEPEEIARYVEDLALWGVNAMFLIFPRINLIGWDDPNTEKILAVFRKLYTAAKAMNLKTGFQSSNQDFGMPYPQVSADKSLLTAKAGNLICPSTEAGYKHLRDLLFKTLDIAAEIGVDYMTFWSYDEGGCCCKKCWPWSANGLYNYAKRMSREMKEKYPHLKILLSTWYFGRGDNHWQDWPAFYERLRADVDAGDIWLDGILIETRDHPSCKYVLEHGAPTDKIPLLTFPDPSMVGLEPWGCIGGVVTPRLMRQQEDEYRHLTSGGYMYTEGIFDDINKVFCASLFWDSDITMEETAEDYIRYEFPMMDVAKCREMFWLMEDNHLLTYKFTQKPADIEKAYRVREIANELNAQIIPSRRMYWRWRMFYIHAQLDVIRFTNCEKLGWPYKEKYTREYHLHFWEDCLAGDREAEKYLLELIRIYHAQEINDEKKYYLHIRCRPPLRNPDIASLET